MILQIISISQFDYLLFSSNSNKPTQHLDNQSKNHSNFSSQTNKIKKISFVILFGNKYLRYLYIESNSPNSNNIKSIDKKPLWFSINLHKQTLQVPHPLSLFMANEGPTYSTSPSIICIHREMMFSVSSTPAIVPESTAPPLRHVEISITLAVLAQIALMTTSQRKPNRWRKLDSQIYTGCFITTMEYLIRNRTYPM